MTLHIDMGPIEALRVHLPDGMTLPNVHPQTGELLTRGALEWLQNVKSVRYSPPSAPTRTVEEWDDDCEVMISSRELTDAEFATARREYNKALAEYRRTGGTMRVAGHVEILGRFGCDDGSTVEGTWTGTEWIWSALEISKIG